MLQLFLNKFNRFFTISILLALLLLTGVFAIINQLNKNIQIDQELVFEIAKGQNYEDIFIQLEQHKIIKNYKINLIIFKIVNKINPSFYFKAGEYKIEPGLNYLDVTRKFTNGELYLRKYTIIEGSTSHEVVKLLNEIEHLNGEIIDVPSEGSLLPDTYFYKKGDTRQAQINLMQENMTNELSKIWSERDLSIPLKNKEELLTLASIVEKETGLITERDHVAGVFINRINKKMKLQSDPTVIYAVTKGEYKLARPIYKKDLKKPSRYNTYHIFGLPPSPIANPGKDAIIATARPKITKDLYFVSDGYGKHKFARTLTEHNKNVKKLREIERIRKNAK